MLALTSNEQPLCTFCLGWVVAFAPPPLDHCGLTPFNRIGDCTGAVGGIVAAILLVLCICFVLRRKRNKQAGEKRVAAKQQKEKKKLQQQQEKKVAGPWLGFLRRKKGGPGTGTLIRY